MRLREAACLLYFWHLIMEEGPFPITAFLQRLVDKSIRPTRLGGFGHGGHGGQTIPKTSSLPLPTETH